MPRLQHRGQPGAIAGPRTRKMRMSGKDRADARDHDQSDQKSADTQAFKKSELLVHHKSLIRSSSKANNVHKSLICSSSKSVNKNEPSNIHRYVGTKRKRYPDSSGTFFGRRNVIEHPLPQDDAAVEVARSYRCEYCVK